MKLSTIAYGVGSKENQILSKNIKEKGLFPVVSQGAALFDGYADDRDRVIDNIPLVLFGDHTRNVKYIDFPFIIGADGTKFLKSIQLSPKFLYYVLLLVADGLRDRGYARHFSLLQKEYLPLPPIAEQERIITKIESILPTVQSYGNASSELIKLDASLTGALKKSVLQHAIQGKLVPQDPNDEPASVLLERIAKERAKMGKKAAKSMSRIERRDRGTYEIFPDGSEKDISGEIPFDIPDSWEWCRLREACFSFQYGTAKKSEKKGLAAVLRMGNIQDGEIDFSNLVFSNDSSDFLAYELRCGDVLFNRTNSKELVGKSAIFRGHNTPTIFAGYLIRIIKGDYLNSEYLNCFLNSPFAWIQGRSVLSLGVNQANISGAKLANYLFPLPPLKEQVRIISLIKSLPI